MNLEINDKFMKPNLFGYSIVPFKLEGNKEPPKDIPRWRVARTNARSMGKAMFTHTKPCLSCGSLLRRVYNVECYDCWKLENKR